MNSNRSVGFHFFIVFASSTIYCVLGLYEPVYYTEITDNYFAFQEVKYDTLNKNYVVKTLYKDKKIYIACPLEDALDSSALEIQKRVTGEAAVTPQCKLSPKPRIYLSKNPEVYHAAGFSIDFDYLPWGGHDSYEPAVPPSQYNAVIGLIYFKFDQIYKRIAVLRYNIVGGKLLKTEPSHNIWEYEKNKEIFGYDIDSLYHKVIDVVSVTTGLFGHLLKLPALYDSETSSSKYVYLQNIKLRAPEYFWKTVTLEFSFQDQKYKYGILFMLHQVPHLDLNTKPGIKKFCQEYDIVKLGWTFLNDKDYYAPMYGCPLDNNIMELFGEQVEGKFEDFNLNSLSLLKLDEEGNLMLKNVNVVEEIEKFEGDL